VYAIKKHIDADVGAHHTHASLVRVGHTNEYVLRSVFKKVYGQTVSDYIIRVRMELAYFLITHKDDLIEDIARQCGYSTGSHFGKIFRQTFGVTPGSLRNE
jgi:AraC family transcriptional regulator